MSSLAQSRTLPEPRAGSATLLPWKRAGALLESTQAAFQLPILRRSAAFLDCLLQDRTVDLGLASSVVALDPGFTYRILRLANQELSEGADRIWQVPLAVVAAGRAGLQEVVATSVQLTLPQASGHHPFEALIMDAVQRACVAQLLARELGNCLPQKCFLSGLMLAVPLIVKVCLPAHLGSSSALLSDMCQTLPATVVRATLAQPVERAGPGNAMVSAVLIADALLRACRRPNPASHLQSLATCGFWQSWPKTSMAERLRLLRQGGELIKWVEGNLLVTDPWKFMTRVECPHEQE